MVNSTREWDWMDKGIRHMDYDGMGDFSRFPNKTEAKKRGWMERVRAFFSL